MVSLGLVPACLAKKADSRKAYYLMNLNTMYCIYYNNYLFDIY